MPVPIPMPKFGMMMAEGTVAGRLRSAFEMMIKAIAGANDCVVVTDNERNFVGVQILNLMFAGD